MALTDVEKHQFLSALAKTGVIASACRMAHVTYTEVTSLRKKDDDFSTAWFDALEQATDSLETEARRRALEGFNEPVIYQGQMTPEWERDADGQMVMVTHDTGVTDSSGKPIVTERPKQLVVDGVPQFLSVRKHSDPLLMFLLKGNRTKFKDSSTLALTGAGGGAVLIDETSRVARLAALMAVAQSRAQGENFDDIA